MDMLWFKILCWFTAVLVLNLISDGFFLRSIVKAITSVFKFLYKRTGLKRLVAWRIKSRAKILKTGECQFQLCIGGKHYKVLLYQDWLCDGETFFWAETRDEQETCDCDHQNHKVVDELVWAAKEWTTWEEDIRITRQEIIDQALSTEIPWSIEASRYCPSIDAH